MPSNLTTKVYSFVWSRDAHYRASITFSATEPNKWIFSKCDFVGVTQGFYNLDDWEFLGALADEIKALCKKEGVTL